MSFKYSEFIELVSLLKEKNFEFYTIQNFIRNKEGRTTNKRAVIMRHDVDRFPYKSVYFSEFEHELDVHSTYYFRVNQNQNFPKESILKIKSLGHEVGYHYETLTKMKGDHQKAIALFQKNLQKFRQITECHTVSMHGAPFQKYNNLDLIQELNLEHYQLQGDAIREIKSYNPIYLTDTGGSWASDEAINFRDYINPNAVKLNPKSLEFEHLIEQEDCLLYINTHPERWSRTQRGFFLAKTIDLGINFLKKTRRKFIS